MICAHVSIKKKNACQQKQPLIFSCSFRVLFLVKINNFSPQHKITVEVKQPSSYFSFRDLGTFPAKNNHTKIYNGCGRNGREWQRLAQRAETDKDWQRLTGNGRDRQR